MNYRSNNLTLFFVAITSFLLGTVVSEEAAQSQVRPLLEFKKGIADDPLGKVLGSWNFSLLNDVNVCPKTWYGIGCDDRGFVVSIILDRLDLAGELKLNTLTGLSYLANLSLAGNFFKGRFVPTVGSLSALQRLDLSENQFYGPIPARINNMWSLNYLNLSFNTFEGGFPSEISNLQQLKVLDLHSNYLHGDIGIVISELRNVEYIDFSHNAFYGELPVDSRNVSSLANTVHHINLSNNNLTGKFFSADSISLFRNLEVLDLSNNRLNGELPSFGFLPKLQIIRLGHNQLYGMIPEDLFVNLIPLVELDLSSNGFTGSVYEINSSTLNVFNLSSNQLSGSLPSSLGRCSIVDLSSNMISGDISIIQGWVHNLEILDLSSNKLSGSFPNITSHFDKLTSLKVRDNSLLGTLPLLLGSCPRLSVVDLSMNKLSGDIPGSLFTSMTLKNLNLSVNQFSGPIPLESSHVSELHVKPPSSPMEIIDLCSNFLSDSLPSGIGNLGYLQLLNLSNNKLSGKLPSELSKLNYLTYLDLSHNDFRGNIPDKLSPNLLSFNVSYNNLSGPIPDNLRNFPYTSFRPGNALLNISRGMLPPNNNDPNQIDARGKQHSTKGSILIAIIIAGVFASLVIFCIVFAYYRTKVDGYHGRSAFGNQTAGRDSKIGRFSREPPPASLSFSNENLLTSNSRFLSGQTEFATVIVEQPEGAAAKSTSTNPNLMDKYPITSGRESSPGSQLSSSPRFIDASEQPVMLDVYSPDRLAGELFFLDPSLAFTAEELSRAPAEVLGRSSHGTLYKATLDSGHMLTVKWLRVGLVKHKKEFAKEIKKIGSLRHPNIVPLRAYYWGPREQERLVLADFIQGDSLSLHLYETTPRRYSRLSFSQRLKIAVDVARCLLYLQDRGLPHGNLKPTNILLSGPEFNARLADYALHRLMTQAGIAEQTLNLGALGYRAPELAITTKPTPSFKADVYAFGVILMELLTRRSAGDIISGQSGAVDLTDWVRLCDQEGRGMDCIDRDIAGREEEPSKAMDDLLAVSLRCILPVNERPNIRQIFQDISSITI